MVMKLTKKPVQVEGVRWTGENIDEVKSFCPDCYTGEAGSLIVKTKEGDHVAVPNCVIIKGVQGEFYPVDPEIFTKTYEIPAGDTADTVSVEKHWNKAEREAAPKQYWAVPEKEKLRIDDKKHVALAWDMVERTKGLSSAEIKKARHRILARAHELDMDTSGWNKPKPATEALVPGYDGKMDVIEYLLGHLAEEAGELVQAAIKCVRFGFDSLDPKNGMSGRMKIVEEFNDCAGVIDILNEELEARGMPKIEGICDESLLQASIEKRREKLVEEYENGRYALAQPIQDAPVGQED